MSEFDITAMRNRLFALRDELEALAKTGEEFSAIVELDQSRVGRLSRMDAMQAQAMAHASSQRREKRLRNIAAALARIDRGDFGLCIECEELINEKRLTLDPTAERCIDCASKTERRE